MTALQDHVHDYLQIRRSVGFKLVAAGRLLRDFAAYADRAAVTTVTIDTALGWASLPVGTNPVWISQRLSVVRQFARYLKTVDIDADVPATNLLRAGSQRATPYLYSADDVAALMAAARAIRNPLRAATFATMIGLLACTGMRGGEAMRLDRGEIDWSQHQLIVRDSKFGKSRLLPLQPSTLDALAAYDALRTKLCPTPQTASFLVSSTGTRLSHPTVQPTFRQLLAQAGITACPPRRRPRIHDLRHSFAVRTLLGWYHDGEDVQARMPSLSTYLGHVDPAATYWYLTAAPELMAIAAARLEAAFGSPA